MKKLYYFLLFTLFAINPVAQAQEKTSSLDDLAVEEIVVTATRTPLPLKNSPVITRVISGQQMQREGIPTIEALLERELAGVEFHQAGYGTTVSFQGLDARYVLFLVDGERMAGETYGNIDYQRIPIANIEKVEIVRGASSVLYGSNAMGAIVNIITKMPKKKVEVDGSVRFGTHYQRNSTEMLGKSATDSQLKKYRGKLDQPNAKADFSVGFNLGKFRSLTSASFQAMDAYKMIGTKDEKRHYKRMNILTMGRGGMPPSFILDRVVLDTTIMVEPDSRGLGVSGWKDLYVGQKFDYTFNDKFRLELSGNYAMKERYDFQSSMMDDNPMSGILPSDNPWKYESYDSYNTKFLMEHSPNSRNKVYLTFMRDQYKRNQEEVGKSKTPKQRHTYNIPRLLWTSEIGEWHRLTTGVELVNERLQFDLNPKGYGDTKSLNTGAIYVQDEMFSGRKLSFVAGLRADWSNKFGWRATPQVSAKFILGDFTVRGNYSNGYRSPSLKEMYMVLDIPMPGSPKIYGNPLLKVESNHYLSMSVAYDHDWVNLSATLNKSFFRNKIDVVWAKADSEENPSEGDAPESDGQRKMQYHNISSSEYGSVELIGRFRFARNLYFNVNYNFVWEDKDAPEETTQYIYPSPHTATFGVDYSFMVKNVRVGLNANLRYVGSKKYEDFMSYLNIPDVAKDFILKSLQGQGGRPSAEEEKALNEIKYFTGSYTSRHSGYAVCNASINLEFHKQLSLTFGVNNIFNYTPKVINFNSAMTPKVNGFMKVGFKF